MATAAISVGISCLNFFVKWSMFIKKEMQTATIPQDVRLK